MIYPYRCDTCTQDDTLDFPMGKAPRTQPCLCGGTLERVFKPQLIRPERAVKAFD